MKLTFSILSSVLLLSAVLSLATSSDENIFSKDDKAQAIVDRAITVHGGDLYERSRISFTFRGKRHVVLQNDKAYRYERSFKEEGNDIVDVYENGVFIRTVNGDKVELSGRKLDRQIEDVNAVSYFAMLPYKLNDGAVIKEHVAEVTIKGKKYDKIKVTFQQQGGGHSPDNVFFYWFDQSTGFMEFLAYNSGGNRFRAPYNARTVNGIRFVDNINFGGGDFSGEHISTYDAHYEADELKELSRIILEDVKVEVLD